MPDISTSRAECLTQDRIPLGGAPGSGPFNAGSLVLSGPLDANLASLSNLAPRNPLDLLTVHLAASVPRQVLSGSRLFDIEEITANNSPDGFRIRVFEAGDFTPQSGALATIVDEAIPSVTHRFRPVPGGLTVETTRRASPAMESATYYDGTGADGGETCWLRLPKSTLAPWNGSPAQPPASGSAGCNLTTHAYTAVDGIHQPAGRATTLPPAARVMSTQPTTPELAALIDLLEDHSGITTTTAYSGRTAVTTTSAPGLSFSTKAISDLAGRPISHTDPTATAEQLSARFGRKNKKRTEQIGGILETLKGLGRARNKGMTLTCSSGLLKELTLQSANDPNRTNHTSWQ